MITTPRLPQIVCTAALLGLGSVAQAQVNIATGAPVVAGSVAADYPNGGINTGGIFSTANVTDGQNASPDNDTGGITEPSQDGSFWLGPDGSQTAFFVIDLGTAQGIGSFQLFNTRNGAFNDRGTGLFEIRASNDLNDLNAPTSTATLLASGSLTEQTYVGGSPAATPIVPDTFSSSSATPFQFVRFDALSIGAAADKGFPDAGVGLNEIRVIAVPEPGSAGLLCVGALGLLARRRRA